MTTSAPRPTGRLITLVRMFRGPMARRGDGLELLTLTAVMLVALLLLLVMLVVGSIIYADVSARGIQESHSRHEVVAVLTEDAPSPSAGGHGNVGTGKSDVPAQWRLPNGTTRTGSVEASDGLKAGAKVDIWVDRQGGLVDPPATPTSAMLTAVVVGAGGWLAGVGLLALAQFGIHCLLDRRRYAAWEREWALVEPGWNNHRR